MSELFPFEAQKIGFVLLLSFLIGLEHEEHKQEGRSHYVFGGVRTFPLLGILGYTAALLSPGNFVIFAVGLAVVGALMALSFYHKLGSSQTPGITSEASGLLTYLLGAVIYQEHFWVAITLVVIGVLLLELKAALEGLARKIPSSEILTFTKFLLLSAVILPILPNEPISRFHLNPRQAWLIVVAISAISYGSYILQKFIGSRGVIPSAILGGAYSSTATTIALSKRSVGSHESRLYSGAILVSSGVMYVRLAILVSIFNSILRIRLAPTLTILGFLTILFGVLWSRRGARSKSSGNRAVLEKNPLEIHSALLFSGLFIGMLVLTHVILEYVGALGLYGLSVVTGVTDVDPFILGLTQSAGSSTPAITAISGVLIAASSNNIAKGVYARIWADRETGRLSFILLMSLAVLGLVPLVFFLTEQG